MGTGACDIANFVERFPGTYANQRLHDSRVKYGNNCDIMNRRQFMVGVAATAIARPSVPTTIADLIQSFSVMVIKDNTIENMVPIPVEIRVTWNTVPFLKGFVTVPGFDVDDVFEVNAP